MGLALRQWIILMAFYTVYLIFGAAVFYKIENELEAERRAAALQERISINELLVEFTAPDDLEIQNAILTELSMYCKRPVTNYTTDEYEDPFQWTFYHAIFFAFTVCSTLGYGNTTPSTTFSRYFMIAYAMVGMPVNIILYSYLGEYFGKRLVAVYKRYKQYKMANNEDYVPQSWSMIGQITLTLIPASIVLIFLPSCLFSYFEGWPYSVSVYYSFVTLSTIGFGDFIPTFQPHQEREFGIYFQFYQGFVLLWFVFGLSYILMLIGFVARGMRSKRIARLENQLAENIKLTHQRIWHGVGKDVGYLRKILNEIYLLRFRPAYDEPVAVCCIKHARSLSCPDLTESVVQSPCLQRKRAQSDAYFSADNTAAVDDHFIENSSEVLARVVLALSTFENVNPEEAVLTDPGDGGFDLFSDDEILKDEMVPKRPRATSLFFHKGQSFKPNSCTTTPPLTWSGDNTHIQQYINDQYREDKKEKAMDNDASKSNTRPNSIKIVVDEKEIKPIPEQNRRQSIFQTFSNLFGRRNTMLPDNTLSEEGTEAPVSPIVKHRDPPKGPLPNLEWLRRSSESTLNSVSSDNILENTTLADLIRAIETAHMNNHSIEPNENATKNMIPSVRRGSLAPFKRDANVSFAPKVTSKNASLLPATKPNRLAPLYARRASFAPPATNPCVVRQNSSPSATVRRAKFEISNVEGNVASGGSGSTNLGSGGPPPHMRRRFSAFPIPNTSIQHSPLLQRRANVKRAVSPLALSPPPQFPINEATSSMPKSALKVPKASTENDS